MTPAKQPEFAPDLLGLLAATQPATGLHDLLGRLADWWQRATAAAEVLIVAAAADGAPDSWAVCRDGRPAESSPAATDSDKTLSVLLAPQPSTTPVDDAERISRLTNAGRTIGGIKILRSPLTEIPQDWLTATALLLVRARDLEERLRDARLAALAEFAAGAGHEINNPLATILICAQRLQQQSTNPESRRLLATIGGQALRVRDMIGDVMLFARPPAPQIESVDLAQSVAEVLSRFEEQCAACGISVAFAPAPELHVQADSTQLLVVISELLRNAVESQLDGGRVDVACRAGTGDSSGFAILSMADAGAGLDETSRRHLFDPFYSGRPAGRGLGFGLSKVWRIVDLHGGRIEVAEPAAGGLLVTVFWPMSAGAG